MPEQQDETTDPPTLAGKLDHLFRTVRAPGGGEHSLEHVARAIAASGGPTISATYLWQLRRGARDNPRMSHLAALAGFFGVDPAYFFPGELREDAAAAALLRDGGMRTLAEVAAELTPTSRGLVTEVAAHIRLLEQAAPA